MHKKWNDGISVMMLTYNHPENIEEALCSVAWIKNIFIIDSFSTENTLQILKKYTANIFQHKISGDFSAQRNYGLEKVPTKWILSLDSDETLPPNAKDIIIRLIKDNKYDGYWFRRRNYIDNKTFLKYGYFYPDYQLRLFRADKNIRYKGTVHEQPQIPEDKTKIVDEIEIHHNPSNTKYKSLFSFYRFFPYIRIEGKESAGSIISSKELFRTGTRDIIRDFYRSFYRLKGYKDGYKGFRAAGVYASYRSLVSFYAIYIRLKKRI